MVAARAPRIGGPKKSNHLLAQNERIPQQLGGFVRAALLLQAQGYIPHSLRDKALGPDALRQLYGFVGIGPCAHWIRHLDPGPGASLQRDHLSPALADFHCQLQRFQRDRESVFDARHEEDVDDPQHRKIRDRRWQEISSRRGIRAGAVLELAANLHCCTVSRMELPFLDSLRVDQSKIVRYLLDEAVSRGKATFFLQFGFRVDAREVLADALKAQARSNAIVAAVDSPYGTRYSVDGELETPNNRRPRPRVRTGWILEKGSQAPRLITAHPV